MKKLFLVVVIVLVACGGTSPNRSNASSLGYNLRYLGSSSISHRTIDVYCDPQAHVLIYAGVSEINTGGDTLAAVELGPSEQGVC
jgi:hypothetical protein